MNRNLALLAMVAFLVFPSYSSSTLAAQKRGKPDKAVATKNAVKVVSLRKIDQLKQAFQRDSGKVRFVTILSPT